MKVGLALPHVGPQATKDNISRIAVGAEDEGLDLLWVAERLLWPVTPQTPYPATEDGSQHSTRKYSIHWKHSPL
ncbi:MAG: hypothetical protein WBX01_10625 [Nitrososphaeraceae archaeon]